jgi:hypothetical protein
MVAASTTEAEQQALTVGLVRNWLDAILLEDADAWEGWLAAVESPGVLSVEGSCNPGPLRYCTPAVANSTGQPGSISATGSTIAADNDLTLLASNLPPNQFGFFMNSHVQGLVMNPGGSQGHLCLGGAIGRYNMPVLSTGTAGSMTLVLDLTSTPTPSGPATIIAGQGWNFSAWYRDANPTSTTNLTDAVSIMFQ